MKIGEIWKEKKHLTKIKYENNFMILEVYKIYPVVQILEFRNMKINKKNIEYVVFSPLKENILYVWPIPMFLQCYKKFYNQT